MLDFVGGLQSNIWDPSKWGGHGKENNPLDHRWEEGDNSNNKPSSDKQH